MKTCDTCRYYEAHPREVSLDYCRRPKKSAYRKIRVNQDPTQEDIYCDNERSFFWPITCGFLGLNWSRK